MYFHVGTSQEKLVILQEEICCDPIKFAASCLAFVDTKRCIYINV